MLYGRRALRIGLLLCLLAASWPAAGAFAAVRSDEWTLRSSKGVSVFDDLAARPCVSHAGARPVQRAAQPQTPRALSLAFAASATAHPATAHVRAARLPENRRDLHLRNGVLLI